MVGPKRPMDDASAGQYLSDAEMRASLDKIALTKAEEGGDPLSNYEDDIRRFVDAMKYKLRKNAHKGRWEKLDMKNALNLLVDEVEELAEAVNEGNMVEIMLEAADVANFALMVAAIAQERGR